MKLKIPKRLKGKLKGRKIKVLFVIGLILVASYLYFSRPQFEEGVYGDWEVAYPVLTDLTVVNLQAGQNFGGQTSVTVGRMRISVEVVAISFLFFDWQQPRFGENTTIHSVDLWYLQEETIALSRGSGDLTAVCPIYSQFVEDSTTYAGRPRVPTEALQYCSPATAVDLSMAWFSWDLTSMVTEAWSGRVITELATNITNVSATLNGELTAMANRNNVSVYFEYGAWGVINQRTPVMTMDDFGEFNYSLRERTLLLDGYTARGLSPSTSYSYYAVVESEGQIYRDVDGMETFTTFAGCTEYAGCYGPPPDINTTFEQSPPIKQYDPVPNGGTGPPDEYDPDSLDEVDLGNAPGDPLVGAIMFAASGAHVFASEDHNRPERRPYVTYTYTGPRILSPAEAGQVWVWTFIAIAAAPLALMVFVLGRRYGRALMFHYKQQYDAKAARWYGWVNQWQYDPREHGVFGSDEEDKRKEGK